MNKLIITGNVVADPETKSVNGDTVCNLRVAHTPRVKQNGEFVDGETQWYGVDLWGKAAEAAPRRFGKGDTVLVEGEFRPRSYESASGGGTALDIKYGRVEVLRKKSPGVSTAQATDDGWGTPASGSAPF